MYLAKLEILGFKSFAQKTSINFNQGVTSIVGPNGCGKTNIVDAIRWCLGEQRSSALRSDKMENVIFNGTANKKPMGMAEVSLNIVNNRGVLPTEYNEVTITRRIFRSGESEYLLNKNICRLKDITNLFMDTGIGANAYSVIELKMVETILSNKAEERRTMFEEAAGVNKYKLRRRLALKKLDDVKLDLNRVGDIVSEVEKKVNSLERQAKRADKYNKITTQLRELELDLAERELALFNINKDDSRQKKDENQKRKILFESDLAQLYDEIQKIKERLTEAEHNLKSKRAEVNIQTDKIHDAHRFISVSEERQKSLSRNIDRFRQELGELQQQLTETEELMEDNTGIVQDIKNKVAAKQDQKQISERNAEEFRTALEVKRQNLKEHSSILMEKFKELSGMENDLSNVIKALELKNSVIAKLNERIQAVTGNVAKTVGYLEELSQEKEEAEKKLEDAESFYTNKQREKEDLEKELNSLKEKELEEKGMLNAMKEKISFIKNLIDNLEGVSKGAKALLESGSWAKGSRTLLANIGNSNEPYRFAVEAALKNNLNNILVENLEDLKSGIEYLKNNNIGKASFFLTGILKDKKHRSFFKRYQFKRKINKLSKEVGFVGFAKDFVETETKWKPYFENLLANIVVIEDIDTAFRLNSNYSGFEFVTLNGDFFSKSGVVEGGSAPKLDDSLFGRRKLLENLIRVFPSTEVKLEKLRKQIEATEEKINSIDLKVLSERGRMLVNDLANIEKQIAQIEFEKKKAVDDIERARKELQDNAGESNQMDNERARLSEVLEASKEEKSRADEESKRFEGEFRDAELEYNSMVAEQNKINLELERLSGDFRNTENSIKRAQETIESIKKSIAKRETDVKSSIEESETLTSMLEERKGEAEELKQVKQVLLKEEAEIDSEYKAIKAQITEKEDKQNKLRKEREEIAEIIHSAEIKLNELTIKIQNLKENIKDNYSLEIESKFYDDLDIFDFKGRTEEVHTLKQQVRNLGPINSLAYSEYEEEKARFEFLFKQKTDLLESEKDIVKTIEEINTTAQALFLDTFDKIRGHFTNIFRGLFNPGDEADLHLDEAADPLEAKIEIIAKPKGKRPTGIELLSGGEKTLTAIALLFAIYLVKPSPFCILDEIDAPLDDANIDRFTKIIKDFSSDTQFVVVTHNKRTMEAAETLYGVTMQEEGVSKLVSVRFNEDFDFVA